MTSRHLRFAAGHCNAWTPATSQPLVPALGLVMFQTSRNGLGPADGSSRIIPENSTLAMYSSPVSSIPSSCASSMTTSVLLGWPCWFVSRSASCDLISLSISSVIIERSIAMSERSQASCSVAKLRLAATRNPSASKPGGMPQDCDPANADPICTPLPWPLLPASNAMLPRSQGLADASLPTLSGLYCRGGSAQSAGAPTPCIAYCPLAWQPRRERMPQPMAAMATITSRAISRNWPNAAPRPSECASQARPRPAASPPSIAPQGRLGAAAAGLGAGAG